MAGSGQAFSAADTVPASRNIVTGVYKSRKLLSFSAVLRMNSSFK
jgi:hypothetical protein